MNKLISCLICTLFAMAPTFAANLENDYVAAQNAFCFDLISAQGAPQGNLCISPFNISSALELAYFGAEKDTKAEIAKTLHLPMLNDQALADAIKKNDSFLSQAATNAKAMALDSTFLPTDYYLQMIKDTLQADVFEVNFKKRPSEACESINNWAAKMTQGRIKNLLEPSNVNANTKLVLLSSIYIKAAWLTPFEVNQTHDASFRTLSGSDKQVSMMQQTKNMRLFQNDQVQVVWRDLEQKSQTNARLEVVFVVPQSSAALQSVAQSLSIDQLDSWDKQANNQLVQLFVPKCSVRERLSVKKSLQDLGMKQAFTGAADFSVISPKSDLVIDDVLHSAFLQLTESGIEAAAATAVTMMTKSALQHSADPIVVRCDKPFYVLIKEKITGLVLFVSLIASPEVVEK